MKAVDILVSARDRFLANRQNWTVGRLARKRTSADDGKCFCSIGGVLNAGGGFTAEMKLVTDIIAEDFRAKNHQVANKLNGVLFLINGKKDHDAAFGFISLINEQLTERGFAARSTITALSYLQGAAKAIGGEGSCIVGINDGTPDCSNFGFNRVIAMFNLAIKNARRRHVNGQRYAKAAPSVTLA